jgi:predicted dehydrogenase
MAEAAGCVVHTGHNWLAAPVSRQVFRLLAEGQVGQLRSVEC